MSYSSDSRHCPKLVRSGCENPLSDLQPASDLDILSPRCRTERHIAHLEPLGGDMNEDDGTGPALHDGRTRYGHQRPATVRHDRHRSAHVQLQLLPTVVDEKECVDGARLRI